MSEQGVQRSRSQFAQLRRVTKACQELPFAAAEVGCGTIVRAEQAGERVEVSKVLCLACS